MTPLSGCPQCGLVRPLTQYRNQTMCDECVTRVISEEVGEITDVIKGTGLDTP